MNSSPITDDYLILSGIQHYVFCKRQCALIHLEQVWEENELTLLGKALHEKVDQTSSQNISGVRIERGLSIKSDRLRFIGKADLVEFHKQPDKKYLPFPVEYKRGKKKNSLEDVVQLTAQAMCLEEMFECTIEGGALFYGAEQRRQNVTFSKHIRNMTVKLAQEFHEMMDSKILPEPEYSKKCTKCSLKEICMPETQGISIKKYLSESLNDNTIF